MSIKNTASSYGMISKFWHWLIFLLVLVMIPLGFYMGGIENKALRGEIVNVHKVIGVLILLLMLLRVLWALVNVKPSLPFYTPGWQRWAERWVHIFLYAALIIMPLSGLVGSVAGGKPPHFYGYNIELPIPPNKPLAGFSFQYIHEPLAWVLIALISIHILAALYHYFIKRDDILQRML